MKMQKEELITQKKELKDIRLVMKQQELELKKQERANKKSNTINTFVKKIFCPYCDLFQNQIHQCSVKACFINIDKNNKVFIESDSEKGALRLSEDENDHMSCNVIKSYKSITEMDILIRDHSDTWKLQISNEIKEKQRRKDFQEELGVSQSMINEWLSNFSFNEIERSFLKLPGAPWGFLNLSKRDLINNFNNYENERLHKINRYGKEREQLEELEKNKLKTKREKKR